MGFGDEIMATAYAKAVVKKYPEAKAIFGDPKNHLDAGTNTLKVSFSEVFLNNPHILQEGEAIKDFVCIPDYPGCRMYVDYEKSQTEGNKIMAFSWNPEFRAARGQLFFTDQEKSVAAAIVARLPFPFYAIEPNVAGKDWINKKAWAWDRWQAVVDQTVAHSVGGDEAFPWVQLSGPHLAGVVGLENLPFRVACAVLSCANGLLTTDGALHHAAAALGVPAVVLWGHYSSPTTFGYEDQVNLRESDRMSLGCGTTYGECPECPKSMAAITVPQVLKALVAITNPDSPKAYKFQEDPGGPPPIFKPVSGYGKEKPYV